jgi:hypothetical protein
VNDYYAILSYYLCRVLGFQGELEEGVLKKLLEQRKKKVIFVLRKVFDSMFSDYVRVSKDANLVSWYKVKFFIEEMRNIILQTSPVTQGEYMHDVQEFKPRETDSFRDRMVIKMINNYIALQFLEVDVAKKKYFELIADYERLSEKEEELVYPDLARMYNNITYVNGWAWRERKG